MREAELVGAPPAHRVAAERGALGVEAVRVGDAVPHLPEVELGLVEVPAVGAAPEGRDADRVA